MKNRVLVMILVAFLSGCRQDENPPQPEPRVSSMDLIRGTWTFRSTNVHGYFSGTSTFMEDGQFQHSWVATTSHGSFTNAAEGKFEINGETLVEETTTQTHTDVRLPFLRHSRIVHLDERELHLDIDPAGSNTTVRVFTKEQR